LGRFKGREHLSDESLLKALNDVLIQFLGDSATKALIRYMEQHRSLRWEEIPKNLEIFFEDLKDVFGPGVVLLESLFIWRLGEIGEAAKLK